MRKISIKTRSAISTIEFSIFIVVAIMAFIAMQAYLKRGVQGGLRTKIDQFAPQFTYEYGNVATSTVESTSAVESVAQGVTSTTVSQSMSRTTDEALPSSNVESRIVF